MADNPSYEEMKGYVDRALPHLRDRNKFPDDIRDLANLYSCHRNIYATIPEDDLRREGAKKTLDDLTDRLFPHAKKVCDSMDETTGEFSPDEIRKVAKIGVTQ